jgi:hypothetical protein
MVTKDNKKIKNVLCLTGRLTLIQSDNAILKMDNAIMLAKGLDPQKIKWKYVVFNNPNQ